MADVFSGYSAGLESPAGGAVAVTPHDATELAQVSRGLFVGGTGTMTCLMNDGSVVLFTGVPSGCIMPLRVKRVNSTGTTATNIVALY